MKDQFAATRLTPRTVSLSSDVIHTEQLHKTCSRLTQARVENLSDIFIRLGLQ